METYKLHTQWGKIVEVTPRIDMYRDNSLAVMLDCVENEEVVDHWSTVTVNLGSKIDTPNAAYIDTNNNGAEIIDFLTTNGFGKVTNVVKRSGFCTYPLFVFNEDKLCEMNQNLYKKYVTKFQI